MATTKLEIVNGVIDTTTAGTNRYFEEVSPNGLYFRGNGWEVRIQDGKIICHSERKYSGGTARCHREFPLKDGVVGLAGGNVRDRYAYFRDEEFVQFLHDCRITTVKRSDPDGVYRGHQEYSAGREVASRLYSDGTVEEDYREEWSGAPDYSTYKGESKWHVSNATWAILDKGGHKTLITKRPISEMREILPNFTALEEAANRVYDALKAATADGPRPLGELIKLIPEEWAPRKSWGECDSGQLVKPLPPYRQKQYVDEKSAYSSKGGETLFVFTDEGGGSRPEYRMTQPR